MLNLPFSASFELGSMQSPRVYLGAQVDWSKCKRERALGIKFNLLLPADADPNEYIWPVKGIDVLMMGAGVAKQPLQRIHDVCAAMLAARARKILVLRSNQASECIFITEQNT